ncbi:MAG: VWA domain-containing protein, partial [Acidobacteriia bacterium]|nr:VWA domain-containing protein [Terriglobia bacterium]
MRLWKVFALCVTALIVVAGILIGQEQQGPNRDPGATVARPRQPGAPAGTAPAPDNGNDADLPKIPSRLGKKGQPDTTGLATFKSDVSVVTVDVAVTDPKGHFIPGLPPSYFRVLEDNVPQQIKSVTAGEAPMTVAMVIEFSARFQQFWGPTWYQTLTAAYGFAQS